MRWVYALSLTAELVNFEQTVIDHNSSLPFGDSSAKRKNIKRETMTKVGQLSGLAKFELIFVSLCLIILCWLVFNSLHPRLGRR